MCAISGKVYFGSKTVVKNDIFKMNSSLNHRGPDDSGVFVSKDRKVALGNNRLAIIDLSQNGHQPMEYLDKYVITFNGEIYNFREERVKLVKQGYKFKSNSDTEVILALYSRYGISVLNHLRGMFAFAIFDKEKNTLFAARDRIGKKPFKYFIDDSVFIFASELKAILTQSEVKRGPDFTAISDYLIYGYVPAPLTGFQNIQKLEPGTYIFLDVSKRKLVKKRYWQPMFVNKLDLTEKEWSRRILDTLEEATKIRMISDVPIGAFLSGGVDSSAVVAAMAALSTKPIKTFTVAFKDKSFSEEKYAANISKKFKTDHHVITVSPQSTELLPFLAKQFEEPFADASNIVTYLVSQLTRKHVTVALNGDGGDENFAGYPNRYLRLKRDVDYDFWIKKIRPAAALFIRSYPKMSNFLTMAKLPIYARFAEYNRIFTPESLINHSTGEVRKNLETKDPYEIVNKCFKMFNGNDLKDAGLKFDLLYFLPDQLLTKVDIASMASSLEARSPLLDQEMINLAGHIPFSLKVKNGETKYIFKKALEAVLPKENIYRTKVGFTIPLNKWFKGKLNRYAADILLSGNTFVESFLDKEYIKKMITDNNKTEDFGPRIWSLMSLELWHKSYFS